MLILRLITPIRFPLFLLRCARANCLLLFCGIVTPLGALLLLRHHARTRTFHLTILGIITSVRAWLTILRLITPHITRRAIRNRLRADILALTIR